MHVLSLFKRLKHIHFVVIKTFIKVFIWVDQIFSLVENQGFLRLQKKIMFFFEKLLTGSTICQYRKLSKILILIRKFYEFVCYQKF